MKPGEEIAGFLLLEELGSGGMGRVYLASQLSLRRNVALKILAPDLLQDEGARARFLRETRIQTSLHHPGLVGVLDAGLHQGLPWIAMELVEGGTLQDVLVAGSVLPIERIVSLLEEVSAALEVLHRAGILHRDLKPGNILLTRDGRPRIADFGLARDCGAAALTATLEVVGSVPFLAPESLTGAPPAPPVDVYALGLIACWLLTGDLPYRGDTMAEWMQAITGVTPVTPRSRRPEVPEALDQLVMSMLEKDPAHRPPAGEVRLRLEALRTAIPPPAPVAPRVQRTLMILTERATHLTRSLGRAMPPEVILIGVILIGAAVILLRDPTPAPAPAPALPASLPSSIGVLESHLTLTDHWLFLRLALTSPLAVRVLIEEAGRPSRILEDGVTRLWHRHDIPVEPGREYTLRILASTPGARICFEPQHVTSLTTKVMEERAAAAMLRLDTLDAGAGLTGAPDMTGDVEGAFLRHHPFGWTAQGQEQLARRMSQVAWFEHPGLAVVAGLGSGEGPARMLRRAASVRTRTGIEGDQPERFRAAAVPLVQALVLRGGDEDLTAAETYLTEEMIAGGLAAANRLIAPMSLFAELQPERAATFSARAAGRWPLLTAFLDARLPGPTRERTADAVSSPDGDFRHMALTGLLLAPPSPGLGGLLEAWKGVAASRQEALLAVATLGLAGATGDARPVERIRELATRSAAGDPSSSFLRPIALSALGNLEDEVSLETLIHAVGDPSSSVRRGALAGLRSRLVHALLRPAGRPATAVIAAASFDVTDLTAQDLAADAELTRRLQSYLAPREKSATGPSPWDPALTWLARARTDPPPPDLGPPDEVRFQVLDFAHVTRATGLALECGDLVDIQATGLVFAPPPVGDGSAIQAGRDFSFEARLGAQRRPVPAQTPVATRLPVTSPGPLLLSAHLHLRTPQGLIAGGSEGADILTAFLVARIRTWRNRSLPAAP